MLDRYAHWRGPQARQGSWCAVRSAAKTHAAPAAGSHPAPECWRDADGHRAQFQRASHHDREACDRQPFRARRGRPVRRRDWKSDAGRRALIVGMMARTLILKRASASRQGGEWNDYDFDVLADGVVVGRIMLAAAAPVGSPWLWTLGYGHHEDRSPTHGYEPCARRRWRRSRRAGGGNRRKHGWDRKAAGLRRLPSPLNQLVTNTRLQ
jgi:hypothetical protein